MPAKKPLTAQRARELFDYDPETGILRRKIGRRKTSHADGSVGHIGSNGYLMVTADAYPYCVHRIAILIMTGRWPEWTDHIDLNKLNNKWSNLREATPHQNAGNQPIRKRNKSGRKGITLHHTGKWCARIKLHGRGHYLGLFENLDDAAEAYLAAAREHFGEFARI